MAVTLKFKTDDLLKMFGLPTFSQVSQNVMEGEVYVPKREELIDEAASHNLFSDEEVEALKSGEAAPELEERLEGFGEAWRFYEERTQEDAAIKAVQSTLEEVLDHFSNLGYQFFSESQFKDYHGTAKGITGYDINYDETTITADDDIARLIEDCIAGVGMFDVDPEEDPADPQKQFGALSRWWEIYGERKPEADFDNLQTQGSWRGFDEYLKEEHPNLIPAGVKAAQGAPYVAPAEKKGSSYRKADKFLPREGLYPGKARNPEPPHPTDLTQPGAKKTQVSGPEKVHAAQEATVSFKPFTNTAGAGDDVVQVSVKPAEMAATLDNVLKQAGFAQVQPGVYDRPGTDVKEAMQAFEGAVSVGGFDIADRTENVVVVTQKEMAMAASATGEGRDFVSRKISKLRKEGYPEDQAVAIAHEYARKAGYKGMEQKAAKLDPKAQVRAKLGLAADELLPTLVLEELPVAYTDKADCQVCPACANKPETEVMDVLVNEADPGLVCKNCGARIPSAYAEEPLPVLEEELAAMAKRKENKVHAKAELKEWTTPRDYAGEDYFGYYKGLGRNRDSEVLERANFDAMLEKLGGEHSSPEWEKSHPEEVKEGKEEVMVARASHWAVGWVEGILVHKDSPQAAVLQQLMDDYEDYPVIDEDLYSQYELQQQEQDWESWAKDAVMDIVNATEGFEEAKYEALPEDLQRELYMDFSNVWGMSGGDFSGEDLNKAAKKVMDAWMSAAGSREVKEKEAAGQQRLPGMEAMKKAMLVKATRLWRRIHAAETAAPATQRDVQVFIPAAERDKLAQVNDYLVAQEQAYELDESKDPLVLTTTFFPAEGSMKDPEEEDFLTFIRGLGLKSQYVKAAKKEPLPAAVKTDALTFASLVYGAVLATSPVGDERRASLHLANPAGIDAELVFRCGKKDGLWASFGGRNIPVLKGVRAKDIAVWALSKENYVPGVSGPSAAAKA